MSQPLRVLHVVMSMDRGGLETMLMNYYRHIDREKLQFDFLTHGFKKGAYDDEICALGGKIHRIPANASHPAAYLNTLKKFFKEHKYDIVHSHINAFSALPLRAAKKAGVAVRIVHSHGSHFIKDSRNIVRIMLKQFIPIYANQFWGCSVDSIEFLYGKRIMSKNPHLMFNAIETGRFKYDGAARIEARRMLGLSEKFVVGHVGRFSIDKNHQFLLDIFSKIKKRRPDSALVLVGDGPLKPDIESKARAMGIGGVMFLGLRDDVNILMQAMDVFVFPSLYEGLGVALIEAQAAGLKCVASDAIPKEAGITGNIEFVPLKSSAAEWANISLKAQKGTRREGAANVAAAGYDIAGEAEKLFGIYKELLDKEIKIGQHEKHTKQVDSVRNHGGF